MLKKCFSLWLTFLTGSSVKSIGFIYDDLVEYQINPGSLKGYKIMIYCTKRFLMEILQTFTFLDSV